jgi:AraC family transcriptional regulator
VTDIAFEAGYDSHEAFTRAFGAAFGMPPSEFREAHRKIDYPEAPSGVHFTTQATVSGFEPRPPGKDHHMEIKSFPDRRVAFVRHLGPYEGVGEAWDRLCSWAAEQGLIGPKAQMLGLSYDDPEITPPDKIRYDACMVVPDDVQAEGEIGVQVVAGGEYALMRHRGPYERLGATYAELFGRALPAAGREAAVLPTVEIYWNHPEGTPPEELETDVCVLLKPL